MLLMRIIYHIFAAIATTKFDKNHIFLYFCQSFKLFILISLIIVT